MSFNVSNKASYIGCGILFPFISKTGTSFAIAFNTTSNAASLEILSPSTLNRISLVSASINPNCIACCITACTLPITSRF